MNLNIWIQNIIIFFIIIIIIIVVVDFFSILFQLFSDRRHTAWRNFN